jgi:hypothetical protein
MDARAKLEDSAEPPAALAHSLDRPRQVPLRGALARTAAAFLRLFTQKQSKDSEHDFPLGDQVQVPPELQEIVARTSGRKKRR